MDGSWTTSPASSGVRARHRQLVGVLDLVRRRLEALEVDEHEKEGDERVTCGVGREGGRREGLMLCQPPPPPLGHLIERRRQRRAPVRARHCCTSVPLPPADTQPGLSRVARAPTLAKTRNLSSSGEQKSRSGEQTSEKVVTSAKMNVAPNSSRWKV